MNEVIQRICAWNAARYEQQYDHALTIALLREEYKEWLMAKTPVDQLDGLCDLVYVAFGAIWKANIDLEAMRDAEQQSAQVVENQLNCNELWPAQYISTYLDVMEYDNDYPLVMSLHLIITSALTQMAGMGLSTDQCVEALLIVCDANDSKSIKKTASNVKANLDKGPYFKAPEPRLTALLEVARGKLN